MPGHHVHMFMTDAVYYPATKLLVPRGLRVYMEGAFEDVGTMLFVSTASHRLMDYDVLGEGMFHYNKNNLFFLKLCDFPSACGFSLCLPGLSHGG